MIEVILDWGRLVTAYIRHKILNKRIKQYIVNRNYIPIEDSPVSKLKKSNKLFILGSGSSINELTDEDWQHIEKHDSIGFNFWVVHEHTPTYYMFEYFGDDERDKVFHKLIEKRREQYKNVPLICQAQHYVLNGCVPPSFDGYMMYYVNPIILRLRSKFVLRLYLLMKKNILSSQLIRLTPIHYRASLSLAIWLGILWGYEEIVLLGMDLKHSGYFWQNNPKYDLYPPTNRDPSKPLRPGIRISGTFSVDDYIMLLKQSVLDPLGIRIYIGSSSSKLYPRLPLYKFDKG